MIFPLKLDIWVLWDSGCYLYLLVFLASYPALTRGGRVTTLLCQVVVGVQDLHSVSFDTWGRGAPCHRWVRVRVLALHYVLVVIPWLEAEERLILLPKRPHQHHGEGWPIYHSVVVKFWRSWDSSDTNSALMTLYFYYQLGVENWAVHMIFLTVEGFHYCSVGLSPNSLRGLAWYNPSEDLGLSCHKLLGVEVWLPFSQCWWNWGRFWLELSVSCLKGFSLLGYYFSDTLTRNIRLSWTDFYFICAHWYFGIAGFTTPGLRYARQKANPGNSPSTMSFLSSQSLVSLPSLSHLESSDMSRALNWTWWEE